MNRVWTLFCTNKNSFVFANSNPTQLGRIATHIQHTARKEKTDTWTPHALSEIHPRIRIPSQHQWLHTAQSLRLLSCCVDCWILASYASCAFSPISLSRIFMFCNRLAHNIHFLFRSVDCGTSCASCQCTHENRVWPNILVVSLYLLICFHRFVNPQLANVFFIVCIQSVPYFL